MTVSRRRLLEAFAIAAGGNAAAEGAESELTLETLRNVAVAHGTPLGDDRLRVLKPVLERRLSRLQPLRDFEFDDTVEPTQGILSR